MNRIIHTIPFFRLTLALAAGIITGPMLQLNILLLVFFLVLCVTGLLWINTRYRYVYTVVFGIGVHLFLILTGNLIWQVYNQKPVFQKGKYYQAVVLEFPVEKTNTFQTVLELNGVIENDSLITTSEKITALFEKGRKISTIQPGQVILFSRHPERIKNNNNPFEFDFKKYQSRKKIYRQVYLNDESWFLSNKESDFNFLVKAEQVRASLLKIYARQNWEERHYDVISALTLGYKHGLDGETKSVFAAAGTMHVLAVSGLHVGIVFLLLTFLFGFLKKYRYGRFLFVLLVILALWGFAFITGLSPSVKRAAAMFTFVIAGQNLRRQVNIYNTLLASAFFLLIVNPNNLYDVGFQLSYTAVFGIVFLQPKLESLVTVRNRFIRYFWGLLTVSIAAQVVTFPLSAYYFHQFPVYFWISNMFVIPAVTLVIPISIVLLVFHWVPFISVILSFLIAWIMKMQFMFLEFIEGLPGAVIPVYFSFPEFLIVTAVLISLFLLLGTGKMQYLKYMLVFQMFYLVITVTIHASNLFRNEMIVYNIKNQRVIHLIHGKRNYVITDEVKENIKVLQSVITNTVMGLRLSSPIYLTAGEFYNDLLLYLNNDMIWFNGQFIAIEKNEHVPDFPLVPDIVIDNQNVITYNEIMESEGNPGLGTKQRDKRLSEKFSTAENGAFRKKW